MTAEHCDSVGRAFQATGTKGPKLDCPAGFEPATSRSGGNGKRSLTLPSLPAKSRFRFSRSSWMWAGLGAVRGSLGHERHFVAQSTGSGAQYRSRSPSAPQSQRDLEAAAASSGPIYALAPGAGTCSSRKGAVSLQQGGTGGPRPRQQSDPGAAGYRSCRGPGPLLSGQGRARPGGQRRSRQPQGGLR
jgi:hypothetical protein